VDFDGTGLFCRDEISPLGDKIKQVASRTKDFFKYMNSPKPPYFKGKKG
jgi:hypothetical protein